MVKEARRVEREEIADLVKAWKGAEAARLERNKERRLVYKEEIARWNAENEQVKSERRKPRWSKPKLEKLESPFPRPSVDAHETEGQPDANIEAGSTDDGSSDNESDGGSEA
ncbi:hypothetical protein PAXRUDRAFT_165834 [Paxillus rubicundulus Ve08.2h10]|uniref:Uncharacterized protein n=1 Tax=Paxillus rubicundulus Ve08.2h10 TaxID=930991 RepID=A0A0D0D2J4_9AGAM|nr:hypothetical protein PAXRUDRAFT_165834 [Paxillus rubicundulus Ve08.2h10]